MTKLVGFLLLILTAVSCCEGQNLGYNQKIAEIAVGYAACVNIQTVHISQVQNWNYVSCKKFQQKQDVKSIKFISQEQSHLLALSLHDKEYNLNVLSFRATVCGQNNANAKIDANIVLKKYQEWNLKGSKVHSGFYNSYLKLQSQVRQNAMELVKAYPNAKFLVSGISLGGALAALASFDLVNYFQEKKIKVDWIFYTFGQPRIGNQQFINEINKKITIYRVVNQADPVPHMPTRKGLLSRLSNQYYHPGIQVYLPTPQSDIAHICAGDSNHCSLNKNLITIQSSCHHIGYPRLVLGNTNKYSVNQKCPISNQISRQDQTNQLDIILNFLKQACHLICSANPKFPDCFSNYPPELQCQNTSPGEDQLIQKVLLHSRKKLLSLWKDTTVTPKEYVCKFICNTVLSSKSASAPPSPSDQKEEQQEENEQL